MNTPRINPASAPAMTRKRPRRRFWGWVLALSAVCVLATLGTVASAGLLGRDARLLRDEVVEAAGLRTTTAVQVSVGPVLLAGARLGLTLVDAVPPEARLALQAVHAASVGVYQLQHDTRRPGGVRGTMTRVDAAMARRGWVRTVSVVDEGETVLIYTQRVAGGRGPLPVCLAVLDNEQLVVVSGRIDGAPLVELAAGKLPPVARLARR